MPNLNKLLCTYQLEVDCWQVSYTEYSAYPPKYIQVTMTVYVFILHLLRLESWTVAN